MKGKLITDFLGLKSGFKKYTDNEKDKGIFIVEIPFNNENVRNFSLEELQFNTSWDWLMIVIDRINTIDEEVYGVTIRGNITVIENHYGTDNLYIEVKGADTFENTYKAVIKFIKKYNKIKNGVQNQK